MQKSHKHSKTSILAGITLGTCTLSFAVACGFFHSVIVRPRKIHPRKKKGLTDAQKAHLQQKETALQWLNTVNLQTVQIKSKDGLTLTGHFYPAEKPTNKTILAIHGYHSNGKKEYAVFANFYHALGYNLLMPDNRAHGDSEGRYIGFGWLDREDCKSWIAYLRQEYGPDAQVLLHGISMGGATVLMAAGEQLDSIVKGVVADCSYSSVWEEFAYQLKGTFHLPTFPLLPLVNLISRIIAGYDYKMANVKKQVQNIKIPVLFIHGTADRFVPTAMVHELFASCMAPKRLLLVEGAIHDDSYLTNQTAYEDAVCAHLLRCNMGTSQI